MEIRSEITGLNGHRITIVAENPHEFKTAFDVLTNSKTDVPEKPVEQKSVKPTKKHNRLSSKQLHDMKAMKRNGKSAMIISKELDIPYKTVWANTRKVKARTVKTNSEKLADLRKRHDLKTPSYHVDCPACFPFCGKTLEDWLARSKQARTDRIVSNRQNALKRA